MTLDNVVQTSKVSYDKCKVSIPIYTMLYDNPILNMTCQEI